MSSPSSTLWNETRLVRSNTTCLRGVWLVNCSCCGLQASCGLVGSNEKPITIVFSAEEAMCSLLLSRTQRMKGNDMATVQSKTASTDPEPVHYGPYLSRCREPVEPGAFLWDCPAPHCILDSGRLHLHRLWARKVTYRYIYDLRACT